MRIQVTRTTYPTRRVKPNMKDARLKLALNHLLTSLWVNESEFFKLTTYLGIPSLHMLKHPFQIILHLPPSTLIFNQPFRPRWQKFFPPKNQSSEDCETHSKWSAIKTKHRSCWEITSGGTFPVSKFALGSFSWCCRPWGWWILKLLKNCSSGKRSGAWLLRACFATCSSQAEQDSFIDR